MTTRGAKQLIYGTLYAIVWLIIFAGIYFLFIKPLTTGPVVAACTPNTCTPTSTAPIATSSVLMFVTSQGHYTFLTQVTNNDPDFGAPVLNYQIDLYDASDNLIESVPAESFIYQNQSKYLVVPNVVVPQSVDHATIDVTSVEWLASSTLGIVPEFDQQNLTTSMNSSTVAVSGELTNPNVGSFETVDVLVIFNNGDPNDPTGASQTELDNVGPQSTATFSVMYPAESDITPTQDQIIIYGLR